MRLLRRDGNPRSSCSAKAIASSRSEVSNMSEAPNSPAISPQAPSGVRFTAAEIAANLGGEVTGDPSVLITGFAPAATAVSGDLTFAENEKYFVRAQESAAAAILVDGKYTSTKKVLIRVPNARVAFAKVLPLFFPEPVFSPGIHATAVVAKTAEIHPSAHIGPWCVIGEHVQIGADCVLESGNYVGEDCRLSSTVRVFPNVVLYPKKMIGNRVRIHAGTVIGSDGFGYVFDQGRHLKVTQIGHVVIHDDVEIGANV